jgi:hypothetical protein
VHGIVIDDSYKQLIETLITCGREESVGAIVANLRRVGLLEGSLLTDLAQDIEFCIANGLIARVDLPSFAKALTVAENEGIFLSGSTNGICKVLDLLGQSEIEWLYAIAKNPYIPFGSWGKCRSAPSVAEFIACEEAMRQRFEREAIQAEARRARDKIRGEANRAAMRHRQVENSSERTRTIYSLSGLALSKRVEEIVASARPIYYFPRGILPDSADEFVTLSADMRQRLLAKLDEARGGPWRRLRMQLACAVNGKSSLRRGDLDYEVAIDATDHSADFGESERSEARRACG